MAADMKSGVRALAAALLGLGLVACESKPELEGGPGTTPNPKPAASSTPIPNPGAGSTSAPKSSVTFKPSGDNTFDSWRNGFAGKAEAAGRKKTTIASVLDDLTPLPQQTVSAAFDQPEFTKPIWDYAQTRTKPTYVTAGTTKLTANKPIFDSLETSYGPPREIVAAIWGIETNYGTYIGDIDAPRAIATQAAMGKRVAFYEGELLALMQMIDEGEATRDQFRKASWAGAVGQTQFMPSTLVAHGRDFDKDGKEDVWGNAGDALASAANYMTAMGWKKGQPWAVETTIPQGFDYSLGDGQKKTVAQWKSLGLAAAGTTSFGDDNLSTELFLPAGSYGPAFLLYSNFDVIKKYNNADSYALAVGLLADKLAGRPDLSRPWPTNVKLASQAQVTDMQKALTKLGYDTKGADGLIGRNTRKALQGFQKDRGLVADGFVTTDMVEKVVQAAA
jgi:membrane-bound lytic murein transglycosylase B